MRLLAIAVAVLGHGLSGWVVAQDSLPYTAAVQSDTAEVRAGPGESFYATGRLTRGQQVEVYRRDSGGWLAIRPPDESFSWVRQGDIQRTETPGVARVTRADAICRTGSTVTRPTELVSQLRLNQDELVELLDPSTFDQPWNRLLQKQEWLPIAPPAGEFRWIHSKALTRDSQPTAASSAVRDYLRLQQEQARRSLAESPDGPDSTEDEVASDGGDAEQPVDEPGQELAADDGWMPRGRGQRARATSGATSSQPRAGAESAPGQWTSERLAQIQQLEPLEAELSLTVAEPASTWNLEPIRRRVQELGQSFHSIEQRLRARSLLERIDQFLALQGRLAGLAPPVQPASSSVTPLIPNSAVSTTAEDSPAASDPIAAAAADPLAGTQYDGRGWLVPVHSRKDSIPPYALLDEQGDVLQYVSPAPGLNLHRYVRQQVGIYGQRGYANALSKPHLTAERVVDINRHLR